MKVSYNWIKQFVNLPDDLQAHCDLLTSLGLEVEGVQPFESVKGGLSGIVVGEVMSCDKHPNADKLKLTQVDIGSQTVQIVCGAPNVAKGQKVPVATVGTTLYDAAGEPWKIKKGKIRGEESHGMICAEDELGLGNSHDGILVLDAAATPGTPLAKLIKVENDQVIEIGLTPNRADAMSHMGVARDLRAGLAVENDLIEFITPSTSAFHVDSRSLKVDIEVESPILAPRYCGLTMTGVKVKESPEWIKNRLRAIGIQPKNNIVDATNYVMHELGQPLHAFDAASISGNKIIVKTLEAGTEFTTLDGEIHKLHEEDLMICDTEKPLCIAGVYGGLNSGVNNQTTSIFLESAYFDPVSVRKTAKRHNFNTDASFRFERGIDPTITEYALKRAALLIKETAGGDIASDVQSFYPTKIEDQQVFLPFQKVNSLVGQEIPREEIKGILRTLDINVNNVTESGLGLTIPAYRNDVTRPADVIEEILRVYGYDRIEVPKKLNATVAPITRTENFKIQNLIGDLLVGFGFNEMMANSLTAADYHHNDADVCEDNEVRMLNPLSSDLSVMRQSMVYGALEAVSFNLNRKNDDLKLFEFGNTYHDYKGENYSEQKHLTLTLTGNREGASWATDATPVTFAYLKGIAQSLLSRLGISELSEKESGLELLSTGISLSSKQKLVDLGIVAKKVAKAFGIESQVLYADFNWTAIMEEINNDRVKLKPISKFPMVKRDFALLLDEKITFSELKAIAFQSERKLLKDLQLFDVYEGKNLPEGKKSYALSFSLQDASKTLTDKQIDKVMNKLQSAFETQAGAQLR
ncbi:MAG: phenylalanine--tRNA ligase subunit beta [Nonlabens sp.]